MVMFTGAAPSLIAPSVTYLKIRAWSAPAVLISMVAQVGVAALYLRTSQAVLSCCLAQDFFEKVVEPLSALCCAKNV